MSKVGKILLILTLIGVLTSAVLAFLVIQKKVEKEQSLEQASSELDLSKASLKKTKDELETAKKDLGETTTKLTDASSKSQTLQSSLTEAESKVTKLETDLKAAKEKVETAEAKVEEINKALDGKSATEVKAAALKAQEELSALQREKKIIDDQLAAASAEVAKLKDAKKRSETGDMPPGIAGKIMSINPAWNFVVMNVGQDEGVVENGLFIVYRGKELVGKVKVVSTEAHTSVADILPEWKKGEIQPGDDVFN
jgi:outer membrane murein-binding lipoprotein Lpp